MKLFLSILLFVCLSLFANGRKIDTLEIFVLYTQFKKEEPDNQLTTGFGLFDSDSGTQYTLDPSGFRQYRTYLEKHLEYARAYYKRISNNRLYIKWKLFPSPNVSTGKIDAPIQLSETMSFYSPSQISEQNAESFNALTEEQYISFVSETLRKATVLQNNPFDEPLPSLNTLRSYLIFHAGHSRLTDASNFGLAGDTPNDLIDIFVSESDFDVLKNVDNNQSAILLPQKEDSFGVVVSDSQVIKSVMVLSESASQNGVNFGINGILINQIARQLGLPNVFNEEQGFPQVGLFDAMDFGQLAGSGFFPVHLAAWHRVFLDWESVETAYPGSDEKRMYSVSTVQNSLVNEGISIVQVPLNDQEYLLIENRQKTISDSLTVYFSYSKDGNDTKFSMSDSVRVSANFIDSLLLDSLCISVNNCRKNLKKPRGVITGVSDYDLFLPGSGLLVWRINNTVVQRNLNRGFVNQSNNGLINDVGIQLIEADGNRSLTAIGQNALGLEVVDFGSGADMLPHIFHELENGNVTSIDTIIQISANSFVNTQSFNQGRTHFNLSVGMPSSGFSFRSRSFRGDSILTILNQTIPLTINWNVNKNIQKLSNSKWPVFSLPSSSFFNHTVLNLRDTLLIQSISDSGIVQFYNLEGMPVFLANDSLIFKNIDDVKLKANFNLQDTVFVYGLKEKLGEIKSNAVLQDSILIILNQKNVLYRLNFNRTEFPSSHSFDLDSLITSSKTSTLVHNDFIWIVEDQQLLAYDANLQEVKNIMLPNRNYQDQALISLDNNQWGIALVDSLAQIFLVNLDDQKVSSISNSQKLPFPTEKFSLQTSDFNRDGVEEILILGSFGSMTMKTIDGETMNGFPLFFSRIDSNVVGTNTILFDDSTPASLGDVNDDGFVDILVTIPNGIQAISYQGEKLWIFFVDKNQGRQLKGLSSGVSSRLIMSPPLVVYMNRNSNRDPIVLFASSNGLVWAIDGDGNAITDNNAIINANDKSFSSAFVSDWPLSIGGTSIDTNEISSVQISVFENDSKYYLFGQTSLGGSYLWNITNLHSNQSGSWRYLKSNQQRQSRFDAESLLKTPNIIESDNQIQSFYLYPSPLSRRKVATVRLNIEAPAQSLKFKVFDISGSEVFVQNLGSVAFSGQHDFKVNLNNLGPDVYLGSIEVKFTDGVVKVAHQRFGVTH